MRFNRPRTIVMLLCAFCATVAYAQLQPTATVPKLVRFSGSFRPANGMPAEPVESVTLSVYRDQVGGNALWQETQNVAVDGEGKYSVLMGTTQNDGMPLELFGSREPRWLGVQFNRPGEVEQPRVLLASVPYALKASDAETLGGKPASAYLLAESPGVAAGSVATWGSAVAVNGAEAAASPRAISGSQGFFPYFTDGSNDLGNSVMQQASGSIGVGTVPGAAPAASTPSLDLRTFPFSQIGMGQTTDYLTFFASDTFGPAIYWDPGKDLRFGKGGTGLYNPFGFTELMRIQSLTGNVGIGTLTPVAKLDIVGGLKLEGSGNGITFPDGTTQTTAGGGGGGGVTALIAGTGLTASGTSGAVTVNVDTTKVPLLNASNTFSGGITAPSLNVTANATIGNVSVTSTGLTTAGVVHGGALASDSNITLANSIIYQQPYQNSTNTALGVGANGGSDSSGTGNTASGFCAMGNAGACGNPGGATNVPAIRPLPRVKGSGTNPHPDTSGGGPTGSFNTAHGYQALSSLTSGTFNTAHGSQALLSNTSGSGNTALGVQALSSNTVGSSNHALGSVALANNTSGSSNTAVGGEALVENTTGSENTAVGNAALLINVTGRGNTAVGANAMSETIGSAGANLFDTAVGYGALENAEGNYNVAIGYQAFSSSTNYLEGSYNIAIGTKAASNLIGAFGNGSNNIHIGSVGALADNAVIRIGGNTALGDPVAQTAFYAAGIAGATVSGVPVLVNTSTGQLGVASSSRRFKEDIQDMSTASDGLMRLRPVTFRYKQPFEDGAKPIQYGLIAEEVAEVYPDLVARSADGQIQTVKYQVLDSMLLNEVQKQQTEIGTQREQLQKLEQQVNEQRQLNQSLVERLAKLEAALASTSPASRDPGGR